VVFLHVSQGLQELPRTFGRTEHKKCQFL